MKKWFLRLIPLYPIFVVVLLSVAIGVLSGSAWWGMIAACVIVLIDEYIPSKRGKRSGPDSR